MQKIIKKYGVFMKNRNTPVYIFVFFTAILLGFLWVINFKIPLMGEDYVLTMHNYYGKFPGDVSITEIIERILTQMSGWTVRMGDQLAIIVLSMDKTIYNIIAPFVTIWYIFLIFFYGQSRLPSLKKLDDIIILFIPISFIAIACKEMGDIFFWCDGSVNYLWTVAILLTTALPYRSHLSNRNVPIKNIGLSIVYGIICFIAAFGNENTTPVIIFLGFILIVRDIKMRKKIPLWLISSFVSYSCGWLVLITAPSTRFRSEFYRRMFGMPEHISINEIINNSLRVIKLFFESSFGYIILFLIAVCGYLIMKKKTKKNNVEILKRVNENGCLLIISSISAMALAFAPYTETRSFILIHFIFMSFTGYLLSLLLPLRKENQNLKKILWCIIGCLGGITILIGIKINNIYTSYNLFDELRTEKIMNAKENGEKVVYVPQQNIRNRFINNREEYIFAEKDVGNIGYSGYYGIEKIIGYESKSLVSIEEQKKYTKKESSMAYIDNVINVEEDKYFENQEITVTNQDYIKVVGWVVDESKEKSMSQVYLKIDDKYIPCSRNKREDVAKALEKDSYLFSGYCGYIYTAGFNLGEYPITLWAVNDEDKSFYEIETGYILKIFP